VAVAESDALPLADGQFYPWQLEGCRVETADGTRVGEVAGIERSPAHDLWVVADGVREHLVPAVQRCGEVNLGARRVVIRPPEGSGAVRIDIVTPVPRMVEGPIAESILGRARERGLIDIRVVNLREYAEGRHRVADDYQFGGGGGMVLKPEPLFAAVEALRTPRRGSCSSIARPTVHTGDRPRAGGGRASHPARGTYEGVDERVSTALADDEVSIGDYVLTGGELPALVVTDAVARLIPGVLGDAAAAGQDSFARGLLEGPQYTRRRSSTACGSLTCCCRATTRRSPVGGGPRRSGATWQRRPDLLETAELTPAEQKLVEEFRRGKGPDESWMRSA